MKSLATTLLAGLMLLGTVSAIASSKNSNRTLGFSDGGPAPMCLPTESCPPPIPNAKATVKAALPSDGGPAPMCLPTESCPPPIPNAR